MNRFPSLLSAPLGLKVYPRKSKLTFSPFFVGRFESLQRTIFVFVGCISKPTSLNLFSKAFFMWSASFFVRQWMWSSP